MSKFIRNIGKVRWNGLSADLYEKKDGTASIRFEKYGTELPRRTNLLFNSLELAESFIEKKAGSNGLNTLINIIEHAEV